MCQMALNIYLNLDIFSKHTNSQTYCDFFFYLKKWLPLKLFPIMKNISYNGIKRRPHKNNASACIDQYREIFEQIEENCKKKISIQIYSNITRKNLHSNFRIIII